MQKISFLFLLITNSLWLTAISQSVGIGTTTPDPSALLDLNSLDKGLLIPRMTINKRDAIATPAKGLMVYTTDDSSFYMYDGAWRRLVPADEVWNIRGNNDIDTSVHFMGTIDNKPVKFKVNNNLRMQLDDLGRLQLYSPGNNLFIGYNAGINNTGIQNHFIGYTAGQNNTAGSNNYFSGYEAGYSNTTGNENHFAGSFSGYNNTTGINNQFIGVATGFNNTTGSHNYFTGYHSGDANTTGNNNYFSGFNAGQSNVSGNRNTLVGNFANVVGSNLTNAGAIGYNAKVSQSNSFVIGGTGPDAVKVGIGTTAPSEALHVAGNIRVDGIITNEAFQTPVFEGNWTNYGFDFAHAGYYKDKEGRVHLRGTVANYFTSTSSTIFILPPGYRPLADGFLSFPSHFAPTSTLTTTPGCVRIYPNGAVELSCGAFTATSLDGISFRAD